MSKKGNLSVSNQKLQKNSEQNRDDLCTVGGTAFRVHVRVICIHPKKEI
jgi:hypothetical protein